MAGKTGKWECTHPDQRVQDLYHQCELDADAGIRSKLFTKYRNNLLKLGQHPSKDLQSLYDCTVDQDKSLTGKKNPNAYGFFTFNFDPKIIDLGKAIVCMKDVMLKKWLKTNEYYYCYEQRGTSLDDMGQGLHVHLLFKKPQGKSPFHCKRECWSSFKKFCGLKEGDVFDKHFLFVPESWKQDKIDYISGIKNKDPEGIKALRVKFDRIYREKNSLKDLYSNNQEPY